jgi:hypothetical protein
MADSDAAVAGRLQALDLEPIKTRVFLATSGPWTQYGQQITHAVNGRMAGGWTRVIGGDLDGQHVFRKAGVLRFYDAEFIAHAREDIPALIAEVERLRAALKEAPHAPDVEALAQLEAIAAVLDGQAVSDFMESFPLVRAVADLKSMAGEAPHAHPETKP